MKLLKKLLLNSYTAKYFIKPALFLHNISYKLASRLAVLAEGGKHPKHRIIRYEEWFVDQIDPQWRVLEVGSHEGVMSQNLARHCREVYAIEIQKELVEKAKKLRQEENLKFVCGDATQYRFPENIQFDAVTLSNVLEHIDRRNEFLRGLKNQSCVSEKTIFLIRIPLETRDWITVYKKEKGINYMLDPTHYIEYSTESFHKEMDEAGFSILESHIAFGELFAVCSPS